MVSWTREQLTAPLAQGGIGDHWQIGAIPGSEFLPLPQTARFNCPSRVRYRRNSWMTWLVVLKQHPLYIVLLVCNDTGHSYWLKFLVTERLSHYWCVSLVFLLTFVLLSSTASSSHPTSRPEREGSPRPSPRLPPIEPNPSGHSPQQSLTFGRRDANDNRPLPALMKKQVMWLAYGIDVVMLLCDCHVTLFSAGASNSCIKNSRVLRKAWRLINHHQMVWLCDLHDFIWNRFWYVFMFIHFLVFKRVHSPALTEQPERLTDKQLNEVPNAVDVFGMEMVRELCASTDVVDSPLASVLWREFTSSKYNL